MNAQKLRDRIRDARDLKTLKIEVPEWGCSVYFKSLSLSKGLEFQAQRKLLQGEAHELKGDALQYSIPLLLSKILCDEDGELVYDNPDELGEKSPEVLGRLFIEGVKFLQISENAEVERSKE